MNTKMIFLTGILPVTFSATITSCGYTAKEEEKQMAHLQGTSLVPVLQNSGTSVKHAAYSVWPSYHGVRTDEEKVILGYSVRTDEFRYTEWIHLATDSLLDRELYDHRQNNREEINVINDPSVAGFLPQLEEMIGNYRKTKP